MAKRMEMEIKLEIRVEEFANNFKKEIKPNNPWSIGLNGLEDNFYGKFRKNKFYFYFKRAYMYNHFTPILKGKIEKKGEDYYITYRITHKLFYKPKKIDELLTKELMKLCVTDKDMIV